MPTLTNKFVGIGPICYAVCTVTFTSKDVKVYSETGLPTLTGWRETHMPKMWRFTLSPKKVPNTPATERNDRTSLHAYSMYDLPSVAALVR